MFTYTTNEALLKELKKTLIEVGVTQGSVASKNGISRQTLHHKLNKKNLSFADIQFVLDAIGYEMKISFEEK